MNHPKFSTLKELRIIFMMPTERFVLEADMSKLLPEMHRRGILICLQQSYNPASIPPMKAEILLIS